MLALVSDSLQS